MLKISRIKIWLFCSLGLLFLSSVTQAYTDIAVQASGAPLKFQNFSSSSPLSWNPETGAVQDTSSTHNFHQSFSEYQSFCSGSSGGSGSCSLDPLIRDAMASSAASNQEGIDLINSAFSIWKTQATDASVSYAQGSSLGADVGVCNYPDYIDSAISQFAINGNSNDARVCGCLGTCSKACTNPVVFDANGDIIALENGEGNRYAILGSAGPIIWPGVDHFLKFEAIINGVCLDNSPDSGCSSSYTNDQLLSVMVHELGHAQGLGHTQVNAKSIGYTGGTATDPAGSAYLVSTATWGVAGAVPTMYPALVSGDTQSSLTMDDKIGLAHLYPASSLSSGYCTLQGSVFQSTAALRCVEVVFRDSSSTVLNSVGVLSGMEVANNGGSFTSTANPATNTCSESNTLNCGKYTAYVPAGKTYNIEVNALPNFAAGSTIGPCSTNPSFTSVNQTTGWLIKTNNSVVCATGGTTITSSTDADLSITVNASPPY